MAGRAGRWFLVAIFSIALGHLAWHSLVGPTPIPTIFVGGEVPALCAPEPERKVLYVRRQLFLNQNPRHAWIQVLGHDRIHLYVNGTLVEEIIQDGFDVALVDDLSYYLQPGLNVLAIASEQTSLHQPPRIAVDGIYTQSDGEHSLRSDQSGPENFQWRRGTSFERGAGWWFSTTFNDRHWPLARVETRSLRAEVNKPPRALMVQGKGHWITASPLAKSAAIRREFEIASRPRHAWLRLTAATNYLLTVNGIPLDEPADQLGTPAVTPPTQRIYDLTAVVQRGPNVLALVLNSSAGPPHVLADLEVEDDDGHRLLLGTDNQWRGTTDLAADYQQPTLAHPESWQPCSVELSDMNLPPWVPVRQVADVSTLPLFFFLKRWAGQLALILGIALVTGLTCSLAARWLTIRTRSTPANVVYLALAPAALAIGGAVLAIYDPRIAVQDVYDQRWVYLAVGSVLAQWLILAVAGWVRQFDWRSLPRWRIQRLRLGWPELIVLGLMAMGFWLRLRDLTTEPIQWDEATNRNITRGLLERAWPTFQTGKDVPLKLAVTSESVYYPMALASLFFDEDVYVVRFPGVFFSTLTIALLYLVGKRLFLKPVGLVAAALYTFSPVCIGMSIFGRYFEQLQFFTLLTVCWFWLTIRGTGPISHRYLWLTCVGFIAMFFSWQGSALLALGMIVAALLERRGRLRTMLCDLQVWAAMLIVGMAVMLWFAYCWFEQSQGLLYGTGVATSKLRPMWKLQVFQLWFYVWQSSWNLDAFLPMLGLVAAMVLAIGHRYRRPLRFLILIHLGGAWSMSLLLPLITWRYVHHQIPLLILIGSVPVVALGRALVRLVRKGRVPLWWQLYARGVAGLLAVAIVALACGMTIKLPQLPSHTVQGYNNTTFKFPNIGGPTNYLRDHFRDGDVVLAYLPYHVDEIMMRGEKGWRTNFWLQSQLTLQAEVDDYSDMPLEFISGAVMISSLAEIENLFARHERIWYVVPPAEHGGFNTPEVTDFLRQHMEVVYEDFDGMVLLRGDKHWPASQRAADAQSLYSSQAQSLFLP